INVGTNWGKASSVRPIAASRPADCRGATDRISAWMVSLIGGAAPSARGRQVQSVPPFGPATVVHGHVLVAEQRQHERELRRGDPRAVVAHQPVTANDVRPMEQVAQLGAVAKSLAAGPARRSDRDIDGAGDVP